MGKYTSQVRKAPEKPKEGAKFGSSAFGCLLMIVIPAISIFLAKLLIDYGLENKWPIPFELRGYVVLPDIFYKSSGLMIIFGPILRINNFYAYVVASLLIILLLGGLVSVIFVAVLNALNPRHLKDEFYVPPPNTKINKRYKR